MCSADICCRLSVTRRYCVETAKLSTTLFLQSDSHKILVFFLTQNIMMIFGRDPLPLRGVESRMQEYEKSRFSTNISLYLGNDTRQGHNLLRLLWNANKKLYISFRMVPFSMTLSNLANYSMTRSIAQSLCDNWFFVLLVTTLFQYVQY